MNLPLMSGIDFLPFRPLNEFIAKDCFLLVYGKSAIPTLMPRFSEPERVFAEHTAQRSKPSAEWLKQNRFCLPICWFPRGFG